MTMTNTCSCGCSSMTDLTEAREECGCGCECCGEKPSSREQEITQLLTLRQSIDRRLTELGS
jgi:hypothetical protein